MTAEVAVINKMGVALAADSAVTVVKGQGRKVYNTANKLFRLSNFHPVGIMIFGNSELMGIPWETIIKTYTNKLKDQQFDTVQEYADQFITSLNDGSPLFPPSEQERYVYTTIAEFFFMIMGMIQRKVDAKINEVGEINKAEIRNIASKAITHFLNVLKEQDKLTTVPEEHAKDIINTYSKQIEEVKKDTFYRLPINITKSLDAKLTEICCELFIRKINTPRSSSGIVIAGFGDKEYFPSVVSYFIEGVANNKLKYDQTHKVEASTTMTAAIVPFAQQEMVYTFVEGVNPDYVNYTNQYLVEIFQGYPNIILDNLNDLTDSEKNKISRKLKKISDGLVNDFGQTMIDYRQKEFVDPLVNAVAALPKEELAVLAESLVNITALKQKMSMSYETVGGFIDVAVITKGDGFDWIKQKKICN
ncbi:hypothetical protein [Anabaena azotica]|uniref:Uncharacterized protein n=1 Tax=Anabaena azotica FACHB-119 TaxID=947527 RepID=A0ABR8DDA8_9NOST|nr:hypothetical protein [Anabaena azotica]MBD2505187.1 hypothetical protein [Anabaena azotica FACHB-119]